MMMMRWNIAVSQALMRMKSLLLMLLPLSSSGRKSAVKRLLIIMREGQERSRGRGGGIA